MKRSIYNFIICCKIIEQLELAIITMIVIYVPTINVTKQESGYRQRRDSYVRYSFEGMFFYALPVFFALTKMISTNFLLINFR